MGLFDQIRWSIRDRALQPRGSDYHHFRRIVIPGSRGTTEIDQLIVSKFGIFVVELKDRSGWIFADADAAYWTAVHFGRKFKFQNPLRQNYGHMKALEAFLGVGQQILHCLVVFRGSFEFKTPIPEGVLCHSYWPWIASRRDVVLDDAAVDRIVRTLKSGAGHGWLAGRKHAQSVQARYSSDTTCPKCGGILQMRTQSRGPQPGSQFLGCTNYPVCKYTRSSGAK